MDSGIRRDHPHFRKHANVDQTLGWHKDFTVDGGGPFDDKNGHGTHVAGIIAGEWRVPPDAPQGDSAAARGLALPEERAPRTSNTNRPSSMESAAWRRNASWSASVLDENGKGAVSNLIAAIDHVQEINGHGRRLLIHGVNMSLGYDFEPEWFACGQSPLCVEVDRLVKSGVVVVVAAGNTGYGTLESTIGATSAGMALTINDPGQRRSRHHRRLDASRHAAHLRRLVFLFQGPDRRRPAQARSGRAGRKNHLVRDRQLEERRRQRPAMRLRREQRHEHGRAARQRRDRRLPLRPP